MTALNRILDLLAKINDGVEKLAVNFAWVMLFAITTLNIVQVFYRYVLNNALSWTEEASLWMMVWISFLILPVAYRKGLNISMMLFRNMLKRNRVEYIIRCLLHLIVMLIALVCLHQAWQMYRGGHRLELPALEVSKAWVYIVMPPAWVLLTLAVIEGLVIDAMGIFNPATARDREDLATPTEAAPEPAVEGGGQP
ncbi:MAG: TRAP transporter small permease [Desulfosarcinaceae bacterium]|nr:TRAP transporter small permease [Desulfosarcinaceae bacterium]